ncbi:MAG: c-type cytochrome [Candidatus Methylomirabilales bacterium]
MRKKWFIGAVVLGLMLGGRVCIIGAQDQPKPKKLNPYTGDQEAIKEGRQLYSYYGCSDCHGRRGGGGMADPILGYEWTFGSDDGTLFKLIKGQMPEQTMPTKLGKEMTDEEIWKVLAFVRTLYKGDASKINW